MAGTSISRARPARRGRDRGREARLHRGCVALKRAVALALTLLAIGPGCRQRSAATTVDANAAQTSPGGSPADAGRLPEDPVAGAKATAQWRAHLAEEERERRLRYDRDRMKEHRAVVGFLVATRARYDRARSKAAVTAIATRLPPAIDGVRRRITRIDHWGVNSNLLADYDAMLRALADGYPAARIAALAGDRAALATLSAELDTRQKRINDWLEEAAETEDE